MNKIRNERILLAVCACGASATSSLFYLLAKEGVSIGWYFGITCAVLVPILIWMVSNPDSWFERRLKKQDEWAKKHQTGLSVGLVVVVAIMIAKIAMWIIKK